MDANERLQYIINNEGLNPKVFSEKLGFERPQSIYDVLKKKTKNITDSLANKIISVFPTYSKVWLLTGEGEILKSETRAPITQTVNGVGNNSVKISTMDKVLNELSEQRKLTEELLKNTSEALRQNAELIGIIKNLTSK